MVVDDLTFWTFVAGPFISLVAGFFSKTSASAGVKATLNLLFSAVSGVILQAIEVGGVHADLWKQYVLAAVVTWVTSISIYHGFWQKNQVGPAVRNILPTFGVGSPPDLEVDEPSAGDSAQFGGNDK